MIDRDAKCIDVLQAQIKAAYPGRATGSDGTIAGAAHHLANPSSDHEADSRGIVHAVDFTHDPSVGFNSYRWADYMAGLAQGAPKPDPRIKYIISNKRIWNPSIDAKKWRPYNGDNPHDEHVHISINKAGEDDTRPWDIGPVPISTAIPDAPKPPRVMRRGHTGADVEDLQRLLRIGIDGSFGPLTEAAVRAFQRARGLVVDGIAGPSTMKALRTITPASEPPQFHDEDEAFWQGKSQEAPAPAQVATGESDATPAAPVAPPAPGGATTPLQRLQMAKGILDFEARRDSKGHLQVYNLPANDGGGRFEVGGINEKYDGPMARKLAALVQGGHYAEAEDAAIEYIAGNTDPAAAWTTVPAVECYLRDCVFNRGAGGAARILQRAVGVKDDGKVGPVTKAAAALIPPYELLLRLRAAREDYERNVVGYRANFWQGLVNRWNKALKTAQGFL